MFLPHRNREENVLTRVRKGRKIAQKKFRYFFHLIARNEKGKRVFILLNHPLPQYDLLIIIILEFFCCCCVSRKVGRSILRLLFDAFQQLESDYCRSCGLVVLPLYRSSLVTFITHDKSTWRALLTIAKTKMG